MKLGRKLAVALLVVLMVVIGALPAWAQQVCAGYITIDPPPVTGYDLVFEFEIAFPGVQVGDVLVLQPPATLEDGWTFLGAHISAPGTVLIKTEALYVDGGALPWAYILVTPSICP